LIFFAVDIFLCHFSSPPPLPLFRRFSLSDFFSIFSLSSASSRYFFLRRYRCRRFMPRRRGNAALRFAR